jgi:hypothetical protein
MRRHVMGVARVLNFDPGGSQTIDSVLCGDDGEEFDFDSEAAGHQWRCHIYHLPESPIVSMSFLFFCRVFYLSN